MSARPTDRAPSTKLEKLTARMSQFANESAVLQPISDGVNHIARQLIFRALQHIQFGSLTLIENFNDQAPKRSSFGTAAPSVASSSAVGRHPLHVTLNIHDKAVYRQLLLGGSIALADSYIDGEWDTEDLTGLIRLAARNLEVLNKLENRFAGVSKAFEKAKHQLRGNDKSGSKSNILAHYDLGNDMYQRFLDDTMMYSSAVYAAPDTTLSDAQQHKLSLICQRLQLSADDRVIDVT